MPEQNPPIADIKEILQQIATMRKSLAACRPDNATDKVSEAIIKKFVSQAGLLLDDLKALREQVSPVHFGSIGITLGRSDSIAKFFAFSFVNQEKRNLSDLLDRPFYGAGVYAIYYNGKTEKSYRPLVGSETPIYVGKANPKSPYAESVEEQGLALYGRLKEHAKNIAKTELDLANFQYRSAAIQSGMQAAVEDFMIRLFRPIWNKEVKICFGIGKHGDSAATRANKRSPWDTMHPGRAWAAKTAEDQMKRADIETKIAEHLKANPVIVDKGELFKLLALG